LFVQVDKYFAVIDRAIKFNTDREYWIGAIVSPYNHMRDMVFHVKTTLNIDDTVMAELKREAARQGRTMSEMAETALRLLLRSQRKRKTIPAPPTFRSGGVLVDIADRAYFMRQSAPTQLGGTGPRQWFEPDVVSVPRDG
jgi:hypothetical protein